MASWLAVCQIALLNCDNYSGIRKLQGAVFSKLSNKLGFGSLFIVITYIPNCWVAVFWTRLRISRNRLCFHTLAALTSAWITCHRKLEKPKMKTSNQLLMNHVYNCLSFIDTWSLLLLQVNNLANQEYLARTRRQKTQFIL